MNVAFEASQANVIPATVQAQCGATVDVTAKPLHLECIGQPAAQC